MRIILRFIILCFTLLLPTHGVCGALTHAPHGVVALKSNLLYGVIGYAPNLAIEIGTGAHTTFELAGGYNGWNRAGTITDNKKLAHVLLQPEFRYYLCRRFTGHFFGAHAIFTAYNIGGHNLPWLFGDGSHLYRYLGRGYGGGVSYGYQLPLSRNWNMEMQLGVGYLRLGYRRYYEYLCSAQIDYQRSNYWGITRGGVSFVYLFN